MLVCRKPLQMCVCVYVCACVCVCVCACMQCVYVHICICVYVDVCVCACMRLLSNVCVRVGGGAGNEVQGIKVGGGKGEEERNFMSTFASHSRIITELHLHVHCTTSQFHVTNRTDSIEGGQVVPRLRQCSWTGWDATPT